ncbi:rho guanine nucleotide exchange factor TIAM2 [Diretmus argenteus]
MGNTDSHNSSFISPGKSCSLKFHSKKEEAQSPQSWWRGSEGSVGYKSRGVGRCYLPQHNTSQPYGSWHYEHTPTGAKGGPVNKLRAGSPQRYIRCDRSQVGCKSGRFGYLEGSGESNGIGICGRRSPDQASLCGALESRGSPKVLLSKDGSMRVEFTNARVIAVESQGLAGHPATAAPVPEPSLRTSKGSSLSSEGSWYDSPWGNATELADNVFTCGQTMDNSSGYTTYSSTRTEENGGGYASSGYNTFSSAQIEDISPGFNGSLLFPVADPNGSSDFTMGYNTCSSGRTEDSGIGDSVILQSEPRGFSLGTPPAVSLAELYSSPSMAAFPITSQLQDASLQHQRTSASSSALLDTVIQEEGSGGGEEQRYSSLTLPCRVSVTAGNSRKDFLKSRIRRLSDWTGSLSRKKRRIQEPYGSEASDAFSNGLDSGLADCNTLWSSNPLHLQNQVQPVHCGSSRSLTGPQNTTSDALRQNIYENFMQELETGCSVADQTEPSEGDGEDGGEEVEVEEQGESSSGSLGSLEQLDLLFEKEQGVVRKAGWLSFKALIILNKDRKLELVARRKWRHYWVTLKGCTLLFYETYGKISAEQELSPRYALLAEDSIVQAVPEHPKKENVFCLSNSYGDVFLFQAANQTDLENWVTAIHSASASLLAKRQGKEDTLRLLRSQSRSLLHKIDMDGKMKKMAELQLSIIREQKNRKAVESQIQQWEQNLEKLNLDLFRLRCYLSSLQGSELPNPKSLLAVASRPSKSMLGRLGIFSVSSFHALVCSRDEATLRRRSRSLSRGTRSKRGLISSLKSLDGLGRRNNDTRHPAVTQVVESRPVGPPGRQAAAAACSSERLDVLTKVQLSPSEGVPWYSTLGGQLSVASTVHGELEASSFTLLLSRPDAAVDFGFAVTGHVDGAGKSHVYVSEVDPLGLASAEGLRAGDEILVLNGTGVSGLDLGLMQTFFSHQRLQLVLRREESGLEEPGLAWPEPSDPCQPPAPSQLPAWTTDPLSTSELPEKAPPPVFDNVSTRLSDNAESPGQVSPSPSLFMGALCWVLPLEEDGEAAEEVFPGVGLQSLRPSLRQRLDEAASCLVCDGAADCIVLLNMERVYTLYQAFPEGCAVEGEAPRNPYNVEAGLQPPCRLLSVCQRICKVIQELVDTEKSYVKDLVCLFEIYLTPLQSETFLSSEEMESLFGSLPEMLDFQRVFLQTLEERIASCPNFSSLETPEQFKKLLFSLGGSFLYYADHFKLYSGFCANHIKVQKVLERAKTDQAFKLFLEARNPTKQHSSTLESYLIKPVQRVLKYPLLLRELVSLTDTESHEHTHLTEALRAMEKVASHINEMQKIYEDYGTVFDQLAAEQSGPDKEVTEISMGEFLVHSPVVWLNPLPCLGRMRKDPELTLFVFKRAVILVYRENSKLKKKMTGSRSGDLDPFRFRWLIPVSAVQVRLANITGTENPCAWELVHTRSEVEGRPETVFQLCSSGLETKASVVRALRSLPRDGSRRAVPPVDRTPRDSVSSLRRTKLPAERGGSWRRRQQQRRSEAQRTTRHPDEGRGSDGLLAGETCSEPQLPSHAATLPRLDADVLGKRARLCSLTSDLEAQLQRLNFLEEGPQPCDQRSDPGYGRPPSARRRSSGLHGGEAEEEAELDRLLERDFSVQSIMSPANEDCFFDVNVLGRQKAAIPTL